jgi:uncharacterized protein (DUF433 family)
VADQTGPPRPMPLTIEQQELVSWTLRAPRGSYLAPRASQLSGVPKSTLYDWVRSGVLVPDFEAPFEWSFRDLMFVRLVAWLRMKEMPRPEVAERVSDIRALLTKTPDFDFLRSDGQALFLGDSTADHRTGQQAMPSVLTMLDEFRVTTTVELPEFGRRRLWGPNLLTPSPRSYISPRVMGGEPCLAGTRIPTGTVYALHTERGLDTSSIHALYEELEPRDIEDAISLESRLRHHHREAA